jgi:diguanylate cyclase (GGDEF)-like protein
MRRLHRLIEPQVLLPVFGVLLLAVIWIGTVSLIGVEQAAADRAARAKVQQLAETFEAQVLRALREIDLSLRVVKQTVELSGNSRPLAQLLQRDLLPNRRVFTVVVADAKGRITDSTRPIALHDISDREIYQYARDGRSLVISMPRRRADTDEPILGFARRIEDARGQFAGVVVIGVDVAYFTSSYDHARLGDKGVLALLGNDGVYRARRVGDAVSAGASADISEFVLPDSDNTTWVTLAPSDWDGVLRYAGVRQLFDYPLVILAGVSREEEYAAARARSHSYIAWAAAASVLALVILAVIGLLMMRLARVRSAVARARQSHAEHVEHLAYHDSLTGLPNRSFFHKLLVQALSQAQRYPTRVAVLFIDLDGFKGVNDRFGHETGDELLVEAAQRLKMCLRESDIVARLGGDEFVALLPNCAEDRIAGMVAEKILASLGAPFLLGGNEVRVTASIGIGVCPNDAQDPTSILTSADKAMYLAKQSGKNRARFASELRRTTDLAATV